jgi:hypothetical protein
MVAEKNTSDGKILNLRQMVVRQILEIIVVRENNEISILIILSILSRFLAFLTH